MALIAIPKGKTIILKKNLKNKGYQIVPSNGVRLILDEDITLRLQSNYDPLFGNISVIDRLLGKLQTIGKFAQGLTGSDELTFKYAQASIPEWKNTEPLKFTCTVSFYMDSNGNETAKVSGKENVYDPMMELIQLPLPSDTGKITGLISPIPSIKNLIKKSVNYAEDQEGFLSILIGDILYIPNIIIENAEPVFSSDTTTSNKPIWGKVQLTIRSLVGATKQMIINGKR